MRVVLLTYADHRQAPLLDLVRPHYQAYCDRQGYTFEPIEGNVHVERSPQWAKIQLMRQYLPQTDVLVWIDNDFIIRSQDALLTNFSDNDFQMLSMEHTPHGPGPNTGLWAVRNNQQGKAFLDEVWEKGPLPDATLNDQARVADLLGFSYLPHPTKPVKGSQYTATTGWFYYQWNMLRVYHPEAPQMAKAIHYGGMSMQDKLALMSQQLIDDRLPGWENRLPAEVREKMQ